MVRVWTMDNPANVNAFLKMIGGSSVPDDYRERDYTVIRAAEQEASQTEQAKEIPSGHLNSGDNSPGSGSGRLSEVSSPGRGLKAPPPTPACHALTSVNLQYLEDGHEDHTNILTQLAEESDLTLLDSKHAHKTQSPKSTQMPTPARGQETGSIDQLEQYRTAKRYTSAQIELMQKISPQCNGKSMTERVIDDFKVKAESNKENLSASKYASKAPLQTSSSMSSTTTVLFPTINDQKLNFTDAMTPNAGKSSQNTGTLSSFSPEANEFIPSTPTSVEDIETTKDHDTAVDNWGAVKNAEAGTPTSVASKSMLESAKDELASKVANLGISMKAADVVASGSSDAKEYDKEEEHREHATHFKSWGTPTARDKPRARVRKVTLANLPADADLTLVQSLISGGAIDNFLITPSGTVAYVTFTTGDACDKFSEKYPNGIPFKYKGKNHTVFVEKDKDVNVISGVLQGYLECRASRCVRATGADDDWGFKALQKLAEGKNRKGKVESITDTWRNDLRTIVFRFTNISDAVAFKAMLVRDEEWDHCNIQFMDDPCETAAGVHLE